MPTQYMQVLLETEKHTCLVDFNSRTISYFVQQPYKACFKICEGKKDKIFHQTPFLENRFPLELADRSVTT